MTIQIIMQFLKSDWKKIALFIIFILILVIVPTKTQQVSELPNYEEIYNASCPQSTDGHIVTICNISWLPVFVYGTPFPYAEASMLGGATNFILDKSLSLDKFNIRYINLLVDLVFWYLISCFLIFAWDKFKSNRIKA